MDFGILLQTTTMISAALSVILILLQQRGASLGSGMGASGELYTERRGLERSLFNTTVVLVLVFVLSILGLLLLPSQS